MSNSSLHSLRGVSPHSLLYSHFNTVPLFVEKSYTTPFIDVQTTQVLGSTMYIKAYFPNQCNTTKLSNSEKQNESYDCKL